MTFVFFSVSTVRTVLRVVVLKIAAKDLADIDEARGDSGARKDFSHELFRVSVISFVFPSGLLGVIPPKEIKNYYYY